MADPFTALGTASNILTFVEFAWKLLTSTYTTYKSATGESEDNRILSLIAKDVTRLGDAISMAPDCEDSLRRLVKEARSISHDLLEVLEKLQVRGTKTAWKSFVATFNELWQSSGIKSLSERLIKLQNAIICHMQKLLLNNVSGIPRKIVQLERTNVQLGTKLQNEFHRLREDLSAAVCKMQDKESNYQNMENLGSWNGTKPLDEASIHKTLADLQKLFLEASRLCETDKTTGNSQHLLKGLYFPGIMARHTNIPEAHARTFAWVFERRPPEFVNWLEGIDGIFWIQGKPGSGKSTLMKFLSDHSNTRVRLNRWAQGKELVVSKFFFWNAGSPLQRSQEGLFRSLLSGILRSRPHLAPRVSAIWNILKNERDEDWLWTADGLLAVLRRIIDERKDLRFCFFIDGMDEYEEDKTELANLVGRIQSLASLHNLKLCVSSRPWSMFADAFGQNPELTLKVEDLTRDDIRQYISDKFEENKQFVRLRDTDPIAQGLVEEICQRAKGVFLWVYLVVRDLLIGFTNGDSARLLKTRLERFPEDLDGFFRHMLDTIPSMYLPSAAQIFEIVRTAREPQFAIAFSFIDDVEDDPEFAIKMATECMSESEIQRRHDKVKRLLDARSKGLLEITSDSKTQDTYFNFHVDFLHRTVREFLLRTDGLASFLSQYSNKTSTALLMCRTILATLRKLPLHKGFAFIRMKSEAFKHLLDWAAQVEQDVEVSAALVPILDLTEQVFICCPYIYEDVLAVRRDLSFIGLACERGILSYIKAKMGDIRIRAAINESYRPLLDFALNNGRGCVNPEIIKTLLENGANPNQNHKFESDSESVWIRFIHRIREKDTQNNADIETAIKLLVIHGADLTWLYAPKDIEDLRSIDRRVLEIVKKCARESLASKAKYPSIKDAFDIVRIRRWLGLIFRGFLSKNVAFQE
ncbi:hypothetical protein K445DRAFT_320477 [Daldinia sp. EC12]|nr:hypothetical protein K445DRAFT_320477 [Daldinia sp. EC12]